MAYEPSFSPRYPTWHDIPLEDTPADAATFTGYDEVIESIEDFLDGSTAIKPVAKTNAMTQQVGVDSNGALYTAPGGGGGGGGTAAEISYDNTTSQMQSTDVQDAVDEIWGVMPHALEKTSAMTQSVGQDSSGRLWTLPATGGGSALINPLNWATNQDTELASGVYGRHFNGTVTLQANTPLTINLTLDHAIIEFISCGGSWKIMSDNILPLNAVINGEYAYMKADGFASNDEYISITFNSNTADTFEYDFWITYGVMSM